MSVSPPTSGAVILGFNVRANAQAREAAERDGVEIRYYAVIYDLVDEVKQAMSGLLAPTRRETFLGNAEILEVFAISKVGKVAGCRVTEGKVERGAHVRLIRDNVVVHEGKLSTSSASRTRCARSLPARNAAWRSRAIRTCARATSSSASRSSTSSARCKLRCAVMPAQAGIRNRELLLHDASPDTGFRFRGNDTEG